MRRLLSIPVAVALGWVLIASVAAQAPQGAGRGGGRGRGPVQLPDGDGKELVMGTCQTCHQLNTVVNSAGYTEAAWTALTSSMVALPDAERATIVKYLAANFPPRPGREPKLVAGDAKVTFKEWMVPTLGQRSRDPYQAADGYIYWNGQFASVVGRLDPKTGEFKEWKLHETARPHSVTPDTHGNVWYTGNGNGTIGKLNPATGDIQVFEMPDPAARDPHTAVFHPNGLLYFTLQQSNMIGRLNPANGEVKLITVPTTRALPYGIKVNSEGVVWISYNGAGKLASMDADTMEIREFPLPDPASRSRRLALASDDVVWFVNSALGRIGRLDPKTGDVKEWPSPSGPQSHPYAIEIVDDIIWYNESNQRPDALVRFDPKTETFQSWAIPSGVGIIRHMRRTPDGNIAFHQSSSNRIGLIVIEKSASR